MNFRDSPEEAEFRAGLRAWLVDQAPRAPIPTNDDSARDAFRNAWHRKLYQAGWMGLSWPAECGGRGLSPVYEAILNDEVGAAGAPPIPAVGYMGRAILLYGTDEQKRRFLPGLLSGEERWCQGFSEPGAGSDLASLRTRAVLAEDGDHWVVNGQKVWTSEAPFADWCILLARTDPDVGKHQGISMLMVDMRAPGVTVRGLVQISGDTEFAEVFFDDVEVPADTIIGAPGQGWSIAMSLLGYERGPADIGYTSVFRRTLEHLERLAAERGVGELERDRLGRAYVESEVLRLHVLRSLTSRVGGTLPGAEGSIDKLLMTRTEQNLHHAAMDLCSPATLLGDDPNGLHDYFWSRAASIYGGSEQIQKTIIATRLLGLPRG